MGRQQEYGNRPHLVAQFGIVHDGIGLDREILAAAAATKRLWFTRLSVLDVMRTTLGAFHTMSPTALKQPSLCRFVIWKLVKQLD